MITGSEKPLRRHRYPGRLTTLITSGAYIETKATIQIGETVVLRVYIPGEPSAVIDLRGLITNRSPRSVNKRLQSYRLDFYTSDPGTFKNETELREELAMRGFLNEQG